MRNPTVCRSIFDSPATELHRCPAKSYLHNAFYQSYKQHDVILTHRAFDNLALIAFLDDSIHSIDKEVAMMRNFKNPSEPWRQYVSLMIYNARKATAENNPGAAR